jgi:hypothetical protein
LLWRFGQILLVFGLAFLRWFGVVWFGLVFIWCCSALVRLVWLRLVRLAIPCIIMDTTLLQDDEIGVPLGTLARAIQSWVWLHYGALAKAIELWVWSYYCALAWAIELGVAILWCSR